MEQTLVINNLLMGYIKRELATYITLLLGYAWLTYAVSVKQTTTKAFIQDFS